MREARADAGKSPARQAFIHYLRTGEWLPEAAFAPPPVETKFNPYHDPHDGRFTFAPGGGALRAAAAASRRDLPLGDIHPVKLKPLNDDDVRIVHALAATRSVTAAMDAAWNDSDRTGRENGLFIYKDGDRYYPGEIIHGVPGKMTDAFYANLLPADPRRGRFGYVIAVFHTHPDKYAAAKRPDNYDQNFGMRASATTIVQTGRHKYVIGR